jgi:hypothetical protein
MVRRGAAHRNAALLISGAAMSSNRWRQEPGAPPNHNPVPEDAGGGTTIAVIE